MSLEQERQRLTNQISDWNENRLDLFEISIPDERLEFFGVIRFFYQGDDKKYQSKCLRVTSSATARDLVDVLIEKFHPDLKMLSMDQYGLYESHSTSATDRRLHDGERPLLVQLNWAKDDREGKFILKNETKLSRDELLNCTFSNQQTTNGQHFKERRDSENDVNQSGFKKRWSSRKKKKQRTQSQSDIYEGDFNPEKSQATNRPPESSFMRTISNPDEVMKRKRQQKLQNRLQELNPRDGGTEAGGALKIYGQTLNRDVPYKTLLVSVNDSASRVVQETLDKYCIENANPSDYCLVQVNLPPRGEQLLPHEEKEFILRDQECPLDILVNAPPARGTCIFEVRHRMNLNIPYRPERAPPTNTGIRLAPAMNQPGPNRGPSGPARHSLSSLGSQQANGPEPPYLVQLNHDGSDLGPSANILRLQGIWEGNIVFLGSQAQAVGQAPAGILLPPHQFPGVRPLHCQIRCPISTGQCMLTPALDMNQKPPVVAPLWVNNQQINKSIPLQTGATVRLSKEVVFRFIDPVAEQKAPNVPLQNIQMNSSQTPQELLPMYLDYRLDQEVRILDHIVNSNQLDSKNIRFKLAPAYSLYMLVRACVRQVHKTQVSPAEREHRLMGLVNQVSGKIYQVVQSDRHRYENTAFWLANSSELLHFFKRDHVLSPITQEAQETLAAAVEQSFIFLQDLLAERLERIIPAFLMPGDYDTEEDTRLDEKEVEIAPNQPLQRHLYIYQVLQCLSHAMQLLRRCRVNAALTIQLFSQMFHLINRFLFNYLISPAGRVMLAADWGNRIQRRLNRVRNWAERQGLELAAECHLQRISQACTVLLAKKVHLEELYQICVDQFRLNSIQLGFLLQNCEDTHVPDEWIDFVVAGAKEISDRALLEEGKELALEEEASLSLPLLLPADGYSVDMLLESVPQSLLEFLDPLLKANVLKHYINNSPEAAWTAYLIPHKNVSPGPDSMTSSLLRQSLHEKSGHLEVPSLNNSEQNSQMTNPNASLSLGGDSVDDIQEIEITKLNRSLGLSIVAAKGEYQTSYGIYIKEVVPNGAAFKHGRLETGDQLLSVEGVSLIGVTQDEAAKVMSRTGDTVRLTIEKGAAHKHNLYHLIAQHQPQRPQEASAASMPPPQPQATQSLPKQSSLSNQPRSGSVSTLTHEPRAYANRMSQSTLPKQPPVNNNSLVRPQSKQPHLSPNRTSLPNVYPEPSILRDSSPSNSMDNTNQQPPKSKGLFIKRNDKIRLQQQQQKVNTLSAKTRSETALNADSESDEDRHSPVDSKPARASPRPVSANARPQHYNSTPDLINEPAAAPRITKSVPKAPAANPPKQNKVPAPAPAKKAPQKRRDSFSSESSSGSTETSSSTSSSEGSESEPESDHLYSNLPAHEEKPPELPPPPVSTLRKAGGDVATPPPLPEKRVSKKVELSPSHEKRNSQKLESPSHNKRHSKKLESPKTEKRSSIKVESTQSQNLADTSKDLAEPEYPTWKRLGKPPDAGRIVSAESPPSPPRSPSPAKPSVSPAAIPKRTVESVWTETDLDRNRETRHEEPYQASLTSPPKSTPSYRAVNYRFSSPSRSQTDSISSPSSSNEPRFPQHPNDRNIFRAEPRYATDSSSVQSPLSDNSMQPAGLQFPSSPTDRAQYVRATVDRSPSPELPPPPAHMLNNKPVTPSVSTSSHHSQPSPPLPPPPLSSVEFTADMEASRQRPQPNRHYFNRNNNPPPPQPTEDFPHHYRPPASLQPVYSSAQPTSPRVGFNQKNEPTSLPTSNYQYTPRELLDHESTEKEFRQKLEEQRHTDRFITPEDEERQVAANERMTLIRQMRETLDQNQRSRALQEAEQRERLRKLEIEVNERNHQRQKTEEEVQRDRLKENEEWLKRQQNSRGNPLSSSYDSESYLVNNNNNKTGTDMRRSYDQPNRQNGSIPVNTSQTEAASRPRYGRPRFDAPAPAPAPATVTNYNSVGGLGYTAEVAYMSGGQEPISAAKKSVSFDRNLESVNVYNPTTPRESESDDHPRPDSNYLANPPAPKPKPKPYSIHQETRPSVIGAQEIYRGDRKWQHDRPTYGHNSPSNSGVEKLSFRDKMKMFDPSQAQEDTNKLKSSSRQRFLENQ